MLFASHKHSCVLSCISVKHFMSNATPQNMFETLCITITSSISSLLLRKEASISRTNKKKFFLLLMKSGRMMHSTLKFLFLSINSLWKKSFMQKIQLKLITKNNGQKYTFSIFEYLDKKWRVRNSVEWRLAPFKKFWNFNTFVHWPF